jgi:hypothetical protein
VTKVSPSDDIEGINNFDIFVIQEGAKTSGTGRGSIFTLFIAILEVVMEKCDADQFHFHALLIQIRLSTLMRIRIVPFAYLQICKIPFIELIGTIYRSFKM